MTSKPTKLRTRSVIGWQGALRRHIHGMLVVIVMQANHASARPQINFSGGSMRACFADAQLRSLWLRRRVLTGWRLSAGPDQVPWPCRLAIGCEVQGW